VLEAVVAGQAVWVESVVEAVVVAATENQPSPFRPHRRSVIRLALVVLEGLLTQTALVVGNRGQITVLDQYGGLVETREPLPVLAAAAGWQTSDNKSSAAGMGRAIRVATAGAVVRQQAQPEMAHHHHHHLVRPVTVATLEAEVLDRLDSARQRRLAYLTAVAVVAATTTILPARQAQAA
jgi:hypothetical protein